MEYVIPDQIKLQYDPSAAPATSRGGPVCGIVAAILLTILVFIPTEASPALALDSSNSNRDR